VYERTGGHAYGSVYPGPIGAVLVPQLIGENSAHADSLPFASTLCGACYDACPVKIDIPEILVHLRAKAVDAKREEHLLPGGEQLVMNVAGRILSSPRLIAAAQRAGGLVGTIIGRRGRISRLPGPLRGWSATRDLPVPPPESMRAWWARTHGKDGR
jgi:L-lactate dehydrogenase complex protein LldF